MNKLNLEPSNKMIMDYVTSLPIRFRKLIENSIRGIATPKEAIHAKCYICADFKEITEDIKKSKCLDCPLKRYRP